MSPHDKNKFEDLQLIARMLQEQQARCTGCVWAGGQIRHRLSCLVPAERLVRV